jgi:hypothetical protein
VPTRYVRLVILVADLDAGAVALEEPAVCTAFHVAVVGGPVDDPRLARLLEPYGRPDGEHAWIRVDAVVHLADAVADVAWHEGFGAMVDYARSKGFLSDDGTAIRAHLEPG